MRCFEDNGGRGRHRLPDGAREEGTSSSSRDPWELWDWQWDRHVRGRPRRFLQVVVARDQTIGVKKLECWCDTVCVRADNMLSSSFNTYREHVVVPRTCYLRRTCREHIVVSRTCCLRRCSDGEEEDDVSDMTWRSWVKSQVLRMRRRGIEAPKKPWKIVLRHVSGRDASMKKTYLIGGIQTVQRDQHSRTFCV